jgi:hypothetical protein
VSVRSIIRRIPVLRTFGSSGTPWSRADKIAVWIGVSSLLLAGLGLVQTYSSEQSARSNDTPELRPSLQVVAVSAKEVKKVDAMDKGGNGETLGQNPFGVNSPRLDITVKNAGSGTSLITQADLHFRKAVRLARCRVEGGEVDIAASYDVKVPAPDGDWFAVYPMKTPFVLHREMRFEVKPNRHDRFELTIGPERIPEMSMPWIYEIDVTLRRDGGEVLPVGTVLMLSNGGQEGLMYSEDGSPLKPDDPGELQCLRRNAAEVQQAVGRPGIKADYLLQYHSDLKQLFG